MKPKEWGAFIGLSIAWGTSFLWMKIAVEEIGPFTLVALRLLIGLAALWAVARFRKLSLPRTRREWWALAVIGVTNTAIPFVLMAWGQQFIDSAVSSIINVSMPLFVAVLAHFFLKDDRLNGARLAGVVLGFAGVFVLIGPGTAANGGMGMMGQIAVLLAMVSTAIAYVYTRLKVSDTAPIIQAVGSLIAADVAVWLLVPFTEMPFRLPQQLDTWAAVLWLGIIGSFFAYLMFFYLLKSIGPTRTSFVTYMYPVVGVFAGAVFLGEQIHIRMLGGGVLVLLSVLIVNGTLVGWWHKLKSAKNI